MMYVTRERERILDLFEMVCGARLTTSYIRIGGVWKDLPPAFMSDLRDLVGDHAPLSRRLRIACSPLAPSGKSGWKASAF